MDRPDALDALVGVRAVADEVAGAEEDVDVLVLVRLEDRVQCVQIAVNVAEYAVPHAASVLPVGGESNRENYIGENREDRTKNKPVGERQRPRRSCIGVE